MKLIVYHGSDNIINLPRHDGGRKFSDFGLGFYITTNIEMDKDYYMNETKAKEEIMNKKMKFIRSKYGKVGKYFDEIDGGDIDG